MQNQHERGQRFRALHELPRSFVIPNVWDGGSAPSWRAWALRRWPPRAPPVLRRSARSMAQITREEALAHARHVIAASRVPVSAISRTASVHAPEAVAETIRLAAETGLVGGSIEDASGDERAPIYDFAHAVERITAAVEAARRLPFPFLLTARAENFIHGRADLDDTVRRLQAFERAGADVLFAPCLPDIAAVRTVCAALKKPVNFMVGRARRLVRVGRAGRRRGEAHQPVDHPVPRGDDRAAGGGHGSEGRPAPSPTSARSCAGGELGAIPARQAQDDLAAQRRKRSPGWALRSQPRNCAAARSPSAGDQGANSAAVAGSYGPSLTSKKRHRRRCPARPCARCPAGSRRRMSSVPAPTRVARRDLPMRRRR